MSWKSWPIGLKLAAGFGAVTLVFLIAIGLALREAGKAQDDWAGTSRWDAATEGAATQLSGIQGQMTAQAMLVATGDVKYEQAFLDAAALSTGGSEAVAAIGDPVIEKISTEAEKADKVHDETVTTVLFPAVERGDDAAALAALETAEEAVGEVFASAQEIQARVDELRQADAAEATATADEARRMGMIAAGVGLLVAVIIAILITVSMRRSLLRVLVPLQRLSDEVIAETQAGMDAMAKGDLTVDVTVRTEPVPDPGGDEIGQVATLVNIVLERMTTTVGSYNAMRGTLRETLGTLSDSSRTLAAAAQQMSASSMESGRAVGEVAGGAERQVQMLDDARGFATTARDTANEGADAASRASTAMTSVSESSSVVAATMGELGAKSDEIGSIVSTITGIAEQTNLLALNAAIEAARAGEQGRGFAVVAEEVRKLAEEAQSAAGQIASLIGEIQDATGRAITAVDHAGTLVVDGAETVEQTRVAFSQILDGTTSVDGALADVASVAEQNSAAAQQMSASSQEQERAAQDLAATSQELSAIVAQFRV